MRLIQHISANYALGHTNDTIILGYRHKIKMKQTAAKPNVLTRFRGTVYSAENNASTRQINLKPRYSPK